MRTGGLEPPPPFGAPVLSRWCMPTPPRPRETRSKGESNSRAQGASRFPTDRASPTSAPAPDDGRARSRTGCAWGNRFTGGFGTVPQSLPMAPPGIAPESPALQAGATLSQLQGLSVRGRIRTDKPLGLSQRGIPSSLHSHSCAGSDSNRQTTTFEAVRRTKLPHPRATPLAMSMTGNAEAPRGGVPGGAS